MSWLSDLLWLIYPELCAGCGNALNSGEKCLCTSCILRLPKTNFHLAKENSLSKRFWGKVNIQNAASYFHFIKGEKVQNIIHNLKYKGRKEIGVSIGEMYGYELKKSDTYSTIDLIIPVPLHPKKLRKRGYNQSEYFAQGLSKAMNIPLDTQSVIRVAHTDSQTRKRRYERFENMTKVFSVSKPEALQGKHILIVDDVVTTGSTIAACADVILSVHDARVSIATIASA